MFTCENTDLNCLSDGKTTLITYQANIEPYRNIIYRINRPLFSLMYPFKANKFFHFIYGVKNLTYQNVHIDLNNIIRCRPVTSQFPLFLWHNSQPCYSAYNLRCIFHECSLCSVQTSACMYVVITTYMQLNVSIGIVFLLHVFIWNDS